MLSSNPSIDPHVAVADRLNACLLKGDVDGVSALYHDDIIAWRNVDGRGLVKAQALKVVKILATEVRDLRYANVRIQPTETGYVQQHTLRGVSPSGEKVEVHACLVAKVEGNRIRRIDEYMDSAALVPLMG